MYMWVAGLGSIVLLPVSVPIPI